MWQDDHRKISQERATIIAALIGAVAVIIAAIITAAVALFLGIVQIGFPLSRTPTQTANNDFVPTVIGQLAPQPTYTLLPTYTPYFRLPVHAGSVDPTPTYTLLPTYTPYPTQKPNIIVATPKPLLVTATPSADQQNPLPGSIIAAGESFRKSGLVIAADKSIVFRGDRLNFSLSIENQSDHQSYILWKNSFVHVRDDTGKVYPAANINLGDWNRNKQLAMTSGSKLRMRPYAHLNDDSLDEYVGPIPPSAKYVLFTIDQMGSMTNMTWRYDLQ